MTDLFTQGRSTRAAQGPLRWWRAALAGVCLALGLAQGAAAETAPPPPDLAKLLLPPISVSEITVEGRTYSVFIVRPFAPPPPQGFPVLVVLDANGTFATAASAAFGRMAFADIAPIILVGIGYPTADIQTFLTRRQFDLIGPYTSNGAPPILNGHPTGGAEEFRLGVVEKVLEQLEQQGQGDKRCRVLFGHSLGGLFTVDTLFRHPNMFEGYFAASPSLWNGNSEILNRIPARDNWSASLKAPIRVRLTVGELEAKFSERQVKAFPNLGTMPDPKMVDNTVLLAHRLSGVPKIQLSSEVLKNESHNSGLPRVISEAITFASECPNRAPAP